MCHKQKNRPIMRMEVWLAAHETSDRLPLQDHSLEYWRLLRIADTNLQLLVFVAPSGWKLWHRHECEGQSSTKSSRIVHCQSPLFPAHCWVTTSLDMTHLISRHQSFLCPLTVKTSPILHGHFVALKGILDGGLANGRLRYLWLVDNCPRLPTCCHFATRVPLHLWPKRPPMCTPVDHSFCTNCREWP